MKKIFALILSLALILAIIPAGTLFASAASGTTGGCTWSFNNGVLTISGSGSTAEFDPYNDARPWGKNSSITKLNISNEVTGIGAYTFYYAKNLKELHIGTGLKRIGTSAFLGCTSLPKVDITNLNAWCGIDFQGFNSNPLFDSGHLYLNGKEVTECDIPSGLTAINGIFDGCINLTRVTIPNTVKSIGNCTFEYCKNLKSIVIPDSVESIGDQAFNECNQLKTISFGKSLSSIHYRAFDKCKYLANITVSPSNPKFYTEGNCIINKSTKYVEIGLDTSVIPNNVKGICDGAFYNCVWLTDVTVPEGVTEIGKEAFYGCYRLQNVKLPSTLEKLGESAFFSCSALSVIEVPEKVLSIENYTFQHCVKLAAAMICGAEKIGESAFSDCGSLRKISLPKKLSSVSNNAFYLCGNLNTVYYEGTKPEWQSITIGKNNTPLTKKEPIYNSDLFAGKFPDVNPGTWYFEPIEYSYKMGYVGGYKNGTFGPADNIQRQDFVIILARYSGVDLSKYNTDCKLKDVNKGDYYTAAINWALENNVITGYDDGRFGVGDSITREQLVTMIYRYAAKIVPPITKSFTPDKAMGYSDYNNISPFAKEAVECCIYYGVINGMDATHISPQGNASRAQVTKIFQNIDSKIPS